MYESLIEGAALSGLFAGLANMLLVVIFFGLAAYVYGSLTMMFTAKRLGIENEWLAWIPIGNLVLMSKMAKMEWWPVLLLLAAFIPFIGGLAVLALTVFTYIWWWKICEARGREGWQVLLTLIPFVGVIWGLVLWGLLAWEK